VTGAECLKCPQSIRRKPTRLLRLDSRPGLLAQRRGEVFSVLLERGAMVANRPREVHPHGEDR
jgi:hypothetical protein